MIDSGFHFAQPWWFIGLLAIIPVAWWLRRSVARAAAGPIHRYADPHLLPHLTGARELEGSERWRRFARWCLLWTLALIAMAGPRWDYTDVRLFHPGNNLLILLDISRSMQSADVSPNRLARARQEIQDLIVANRQVRLGLIAFATVPHVLAPITEDSATLLATLPALSTDLAGQRLQGSSLTRALERAEILLAGLPEDSARALLLISDGDFDEPNLFQTLERLTAQGVHLHVLGIGSSEGALVPAAPRGWVSDASGQPVRSTLNTTLLQELATRGGGVYREADYRDQDSADILAAATVAELPPQAGDARTRIWNERFWLPALLLLGALSTQFRRPPWRFTKPGRRR